MAHANQPISLITGATSGIGYEAAWRLARRGGTVVLICRNGQTGEAARAAIARDSPHASVVLELADLASLADVRALAHRLLNRFSTVNALINNAGVYRSQLERTPDGFEWTMAVNHLAHFVLTGALLPALRPARARIVVVSSDAHRGARLRRAPLEQIMRGEGGYNGLRAYADSKLANLLFARELARREAAHGLTTVAIHPGVVATRIWNQQQDLVSRIVRLFKPFMVSPSRAGGFLVDAATAGRFASANGEYIHKTSPRRPSADADDPELAAELWRVSARITG
jgi:NAD(P)-dependent dehydrogenase (short-subunit alcohol dehydrogenase family)